MSGTNRSKAFSGTRGQSVMARPLLWLALLLALCVVARAQPPRRRLLPPRPPRSLPSRRRFEGNALASAAAPNDGNAPSTTAALPPPLAPEPARESATQSFCASSSQSPTLASPDPSVGGAFGSSLALDGAGQVLVVGAPGEGLDPALTTADGYAPVGAGAAYFSTRQGSCRWSPPHFLAPPPSSTASASSLGAVAFGASVAASGDGSALLVGAALLRKSDKGSAGYVRPIVYVADASTGDIVRQEAGQEEGQGGRRVDAALLAAKDAGAVAAAVLSGDARAAVAHGAVVSVADGVDAGKLSAFSDVVSVFVGDSGGFSRAGGLPLEMAAENADMPLQLTGGLRLSLSGSTAVASLQALYAPSIARGEKLAAPARVLGGVQVFSSASNGGASFSLLQRLLPGGGGKAGGAVWGAAHALSDDGLALAVLEANGAGGGAGDAVHVFRRASSTAPFGAAAAEVLNTNGEQAASLALSADGAILAVGLASGRALLFATGGGQEQAPLCAIAATNGGPAEVRLAGGLRLVVSTPGAPARVFVLQKSSGGNLLCPPSSPSQELGAAGREAWRRALGQGGGAVGGSGGGGVAVSGGERVVAVVGAPTASLDERLPGSGGLFSYVVG